MERLARLFEVAARMQDRDENSRTFGNFRWYWRDGAVLDANAVEFSMQAASLVWLRHRDKLPTAAREKLEELLRYGIQGCMRHIVPPSYTNIALMNAENLILLGEALEQPDVAQEGYRRLEAVVRDVWDHGIHEYDSPTYYGVDLDCLLLIEAYAQREEAREQARALLELFWTDIAANWFEPAKRLAGAHSRTYDFLYGLGYLDGHLKAAGWLDDPKIFGFYTVFGRWKPPSQLLEMSRTRYPRLVRQRWGIGPGGTKTHWVCPDITISAAGSNYEPMDCPLAADFPGPRGAVRCYFVPDARRDPYGKKTIPAGPHQKALHLMPLYIGAQRTADALALAVYRPTDYPPNPGTLESHFVMPLDVDEIWIGEERFVPPKDEPFAREVTAGEAVVIRKGTAALGIRVPWARGLDGGAAPAALVYDGNEWRAMRLTVAHHNFWGVVRAAAYPGAALWLRAGSGLGDEQAFTAWRRAFAGAQAEVEADESHVSVTVAGVDGPVSVAAEAPFMGLKKIEPEPTSALLEIDGQDVGREILARLPVVRKFAAEEQEAPVIEVPPGRPVTWEAEKARLRGVMKVGLDDQASGGKFVWMPGEPGGRGGGDGAATYHLRIARAGTYWLWGRVLTATPEDDSFFIRIFSEAAEPISKSEWHTGIHVQWEWAPVCLAGSTEQTPLPLPEGDVYIEVMVREDGAKLDALYLSPDQFAAPQ
ncbi:MAG: hypothetical protein H5T86_06725 [Armatimonadetes bacterium]|nr:hypothetical protein [Armatimonadota bacterium]